MKNPYWKDYLAYGLAGTLLGVVIAALVRLFLLLV